jgi:hypothetical protein
MNADACAVCGSPKGTNPRFCSRSCAARYNNKVSPNFAPGSHPFMPSYVLDVARLIEFHAIGTFGFGPDKMSFVLPAMS